MFLAFIFCGYTLSNYHVKSCTIFLKITNKHFTHNFLFISLSALFDLLLIESTSPDLIALRYCAVKFTSHFGNTPRM